MDENKIIVVDDHKMIVQGLNSYLGSRLPDFEFLSAHSIDDMIKILESTSVTVVLLDLMIGGKDSRLHIKKIREMEPTPKVLVISSYETVEVINSIFDIGADGFVGKSNSSKYILEGIRTVMNNQKYLDPSSKEKFKKKKSKPNTETHQINITAREREVLCEILKEKSTKEIASSLFLTVKTIESHRSSLFTKFNVKNVSGLVKKAILHGYHLDA